MLKQIVFWLCGVVVFIGGAMPAQAQYRTILEVYHGRECLHCHQEIKWLEEVQKDHPEIEVQLFEVWHDPANAEKWTSRLAELGQSPQGVPTNIIGDQVIVGFDKAALIEVLGIDSSNEVVESKDGWKKYLNYSWPAMSVILGLVDGFNPCAMWTLFVLIGLLLVIDDKKKRWMIGGVFLAVSGIMYGAALLAYLFGFKAITTLLATEAIGILFRLVGVLALVSGVVALWKLPKVGIECEVRDAESKKNFYTQLQTILDRKNIWLVLLGVAGLAVTVNAVELLCSFAIPTTFTATLVSLDLPLYQQLIAVGLYDLMYMIDDLIVFTIAMYTLNMKVFSPKVTQVMHAIGAVVLLILGLMLLFNPSLLSTSFLG